MLGKLAKSVPSGSVELLPPFGFAFKREPDVFAAVGTGPTLGMGILLTEMSLRRPAAMRSPGLAVAAIVIAALSYIAATLLFSRFVLNATSVFVVRCEGGDVVCATRTLGRERSAKVYPAERVMSVDAVRSDDGRMEVVVRGPRHEVLGTVYRLRALDPESLAVWLAEGVALVARKASQPSAG